MKHIRLLASTLVATGAVAALAQTNSAIEFTTPGPDSPMQNGVMGYEFHLSSPVAVTSLGIYDHQGDGLASAHAVGIFDSSGTLLVSAIVASSDPLVGHFRFHPVTPVTLPAAYGYQIMAVYTAPEILVSHQPGLITGSGVLYGTGTFASGTALKQGDSGWGYDDPGYFGPNFRYQPPPPPALSLVRDNGQITLSWPIPAEGWLLDQAFALSNAPGTTVWTQVPFPYITNANTIARTLPTSPGPQFFRLRKSPSP